MKSRIKFYMYKYFPKQANKFFFKRIFKKKLNLNQPELYSEKIQWLKYYYSKNEIAILAGDKFGIHQYLKSIKLEKLLVPLVGSYVNSNEIDWENLPQKFVMKKSNASGMNIIINNRDTAEKNDIINQINRWMNTEYGIIGAELHYSKMDSKIVIEKYLENISEDWRIIFLNGLPKMINVSKWIGTEEDNYSGHRESVRIFADLDGRIRHIVSNSPNSDINLNVNEYLILPDDFHLMLKYGSKIAKDFPLVRVDYFHADGNLYIGELTFTPGSGFTLLTEELQNELGLALKLPKEITK